MAELITLEELQSYIDLSELLQVAGVGSHNSEDGRALDERKINAAIKHAGDMVRGYMSKRFPFLSDVATENVPDLIKGYVADIVRYRLRPRSDNRNTVSDEVETRYKDACAWLKDVSRGLVNVDLSDVPGSEGEAATGAVNPSGNIHAEFEPTRAPDILYGYSS